jgi:hypothetical protein
MSIQQNFPAISPSLSLNFARSKTLDPRITFTRTSSGTRTNETGLVEVVPANSPRFDHSYDPVSGSVRSLGLLVEEQRSNLITYSEDWSAYQAKQSLDVTINDITSPDGAETADKLQCNASGLSNDGFIQKLQTVTASTKTYTTSWFVKRGNTDRTNLSTALSGGTYLAVYAYIDWTSSPVSFNYDGNNGSPVYTVHPSLEEYPNGWYRASISITNNNTNTQITNRIYASSRSSTVSGDYVYAWGSQAEEGSFPTSYIPTTNSTVTRTADNVSMVGENFSSWYNPSEGTVYADTRMVGVQTGRYDRLWAITNSNLNFEGISIFLGGPGFTPLGKYVASMTVTNSATEQVGALAYGNQSATNVPRAKYAFAFKENDANSSFNGEVFTTDTSVALSSFTTPPDRLLIGQPQRFQGHSCMTISQLNYYPRRLTNSQLITLTR